MKTSIVAVLVAALAAPIKSRHTKGTSRLRRRLVGAAMAFTPALRAASDLTESRKAFPDAERI